MQIGLLTLWNGYPMEITLPIIREQDFHNRKDTVGHCFHIYNSSDTVLFLYCKHPDGFIQTVQIDIHGSCKRQSDISIYVVKMNDGHFFLRTYIDHDHCALYPLPFRR